MEQKLDESVAEPTKGPPMEQATESNKQAEDMLPSRDELLAHVRSQPGTALVKAEFIDFTKVSEKFKRRFTKKSEDSTAEKRKDGDSKNDNEPQAKKQKVRGQNKHRPRDKRTSIGDRPCLDFIKRGECKFGDGCRFSHDIKKLIDNKPPDLGPKCPSFENFGQCPFGMLCRFGSEHTDSDSRSVVDQDKVKETGGKFPVQNTLAKDTQIRLRKKSFHFKKYDEYMRTSKGHKHAHKNQPPPKKEQFVPRKADDARKVEVSGNGESTAAEQSSSVPCVSSSVRQTVSEKGATGVGSGTDAANVPQTVSNQDGVIEEVSLQSGTAEKVAEGKLVKPEAINPGMDQASVQSISSDSVNRSSTTNTPSNVESRSMQNQPSSETHNTDAVKGDSNNGPANANLCTAVGGGDAMDSNSHHVGAVTDEDTIKTRFLEKKKLDVEGKLILAPLTTVGNLPFRAVCKKLGADITCGEMAMCTNLLQGQLSEWALLKRHPSEDVFGVQLCGAFPDTMSKCAELLNQTIDIDYIDVNVGCPIDLVYHKGAGSGMMNRIGKFQEIVRGMSSVLDIPLTVKMRTGVHEGTLIAHKLIPRIYDWGASVVAVHGRTREQRYTKHADWGYLKQCAEAASPYPFIGNGDILSFEDANMFREQSGATGQMIARGALIKPWIFTEVKEQRHWDISSSERLDILQDFVNFGLMHWGSDTEGVQRTRRFLLEWQSFLHRYIPVGLLERLPQKINERPPYFTGRDDLETLMASANCNDWVKISEMFLGPTPDDFLFLPKHKANSYK